ncbi:lipopolysaccharide 1,3-galactosyltransferase [Suttonella ornithocola]|uniref:Lipopolysaccharide 1,3-galactosyltransferase n=1 Tax=Suttonella ornithocola TaxID=279832 RepID=A0A380MQX3_9GAMM|nr:glycosyltransferase [Suttonella ornithocola]SUO95000.1 lipopolysaccharide 1,3-galactosyltransferase [Suttonella ornithocola]
MDFYIKSHQVFSYADRPADLHIAANFDAQFYLPAGVMLTSLFENNRNIVTEVHLFTDSVDQADLERVKATAKHYQRTIHLYFLNMAPFQGFHIHHHHYS